MPVICVRHKVPESDRYRYYEKHVFVRPSGNGMGSGRKDMYTESNQMQYVCQLLRCETSPLVSVTHIVFPLQTDRHPFETASMMCGRWLHTLSTAQLSGLRTITIGERMPCVAPSPGSAIWSSIFDLQAIAHLAKFCHEHAHISVQVCLARFDKRLIDLCRRSLIGYIVSMAVRKEDCCVKFGCTLGEARVVEDAIEKMSVPWEGYAKDAPPLPGNLRFFPVGRFERGEWPRDESRPGLRDRVKEWYEVGI